MYYDDMTIKAYSLSKPHTNTYKIITEYIEAFNNNI